MSDEKKTSWPVAAAALAGSIAAFAGGLAVHDPVALVRELAAATTGPAGGVIFAVVAACACGAALVSQHREHRREAAALREALSVAQEARIDDLRQMERRASALLRALERHLEEKTGETHPENGGP